MSLGPATRKLDNNVDQWETSWRRRLSVFVDILLKYIEFLFPFDNYIDSCLVPHLHPFHPYRDLSQCLLCGVECRKVDDIPFYTRPSFVPRLPYCRASRVRKTGVSFAEHDIAKLQKQSRALVAETKPHVDMDDGN